MKLTNFYTLFWRWKGFMDTQLNDLKIVTFDF